MRAPVVAGISRGAGATTLATALHGRDAGVGTHADVLVCRADAASLARLGALVGSGPVPAGPVLAIQGDPAGPVPAATAFRKITVLPLVGALREGRLPPAEVAALLARHPAQLPEPLRAYVAALRELAAVLVCGGGLGPGSPRQQLAVPRPVQAVGGLTLWRGLGPVQRPVRALSGCADDDADDETLEAAQLWRAAG